MFTTYFRTVIEYIDYNQSTTVALWWNFEKGFDKSDSIWHISVIIGEISSTETVCYLLFSRPILKERLKIFCRMANQTVESWMWKFMKTNQITIRHSTEIEINLPHYSATLVEEKEIFTLIGYESLEHVIY